MDVRITQCLPVLFAVALCLLPGCFAAAGSGYVDVAYPPANYAAYPSYVYDGATVYYIDGRWYRHHHGRWVFYRSEPADLYRYRTHHHVVAPPVRHQVDVYRAPPTRRNDRRYRPPARDSHHYRAPPRDDRRRRRD